jgi:DeoR/GlpR family transcriptional regulator of sugar metabolism
VGAGAEGIAEPAQSSPDEARPGARSENPPRHYAASAQRNSAAKARIARAAAGLIPAEAITFFYSGSTAAKTAASLSEDLRSSLTIVTNSLPIINEVSTWDDPHLVTIGGTYLPAYMCSVGPQPIEALEELSADVAVMAVTGSAPTAG